jgi:hypothetical protein
VVLKHIVEELELKQITEEVELNISPGGVKYIAQEADLNKSQRKWC